MPLLEGLGAGFGGFAEGALAGKKLGLEQEAQSLRMEDLNLERQNLQQLGEVRKAEIGRLNVQSQAAMEELKLLQEVRTKKETPVILSDAIAKQFPTFTPEQSQLVTDLFSIRKPYALNEMGATNQYDYEDFVNNLGNDLEEDAPVLMQIAKVGIEGNNKKLDGFKGDLKEIQERFSKVQPGKEPKAMTSKNIFTMDDLQAKISALEEINARNYAIYEMAHQAQQQGGRVPINRERFDIIDSPEYQRDLADVMEKAVQIRRGERGDITIEDLMAFMTLKYPNVSKHAIEALKAQQVEGRTP